MTSKRLDNIDLLPVDRYELKVESDDFVDGFNSWHESQMIKLHWGYDDKNYKVDCERMGVKVIYCSLSICLSLFKCRVSACFAYGNTVINQRRVEKSAFENHLEENSGEY